MGAWSIKPFGNDAALDWLIELQNSNDGKNHISNTIEVILSNYDGCSTQAEEALAAISIISAATTDPVKGTSQEAKSWINENGFVPSIDLIENAIAALNRITTDSELYDLWHETDSLKSWLRDTNKIKATLIESKNIELPKRKPQKKRVPRSLNKLIEYYKYNPNEKLK